MKELADVLITLGKSKADRLAAQKAFLRKRGPNVVRYIDNAKWKAEIDSGLREYGDA